MEAMKRIFAFPLLPSFTPFPMQGTRRTLWCISCQANPSWQREQGLRPQKPIAVVHQIVHDGWETWIMSKKSDNPFLLLLALFLSLRWLLPAASKAVTSPMLASRQTTAALVVWNKHFMQMFAFWITWGVWSSSLKVPSSLQRDWRQCLVSGWDD